MIIYNLERLLSKLENNIFHIDNFTNDSYKFFNIIIIDYSKFDHLNNQNIK